ncbi:molybdopterin molybdenumtransferase [Aphanothece hegewaldii CCALA 016]|uniref:Molybdopterin molybdenumtransferase n=1 Tax=Aphanothece hegewaldii CCALA 016 TaxID=2107694 RepID=A0A2T1LVH0_9CHRO|nr:gephyrin-like molybdotransferase Glp [Aphanothece hegewaldii]PSF35581.1 molybdopterin molybdenumtransferase [Aphanothece hegewaldii CCALA 016]
MLIPQEAESIILALVQPLQETETIALASVNNRILAQTVTSKLDFPYWDNSAMDGYAVKYDDVQNCSQETPIILEIIEEISAGKKPQKVLQSGQASRIFTGAMLPDGADTIIIQENTQRLEQQVLIFSPPKPQDFVRHRGTFTKAGQCLLQPGIKINAPEIAVLATAQLLQLTVYRRPKVAIFSTGDELITPEQTLQPGQIIDSNQYALMALIESWGGIPISLGIIPDQPELLKETMREAIAEADLVLSTGGVSVGDYDYVEQLLEELGGMIHIRSVAIKPGKPLTVANFANNCLYFGIPGNPVSALVSCWRFVQPVFKKLSGLRNNWRPNFIKVPTTEILRSDGKRETYCWGQLELINGSYQFHLAKGSQNSANLINLALTNALAVIPIGTSLINAGEIVEVMLLG